MNICHVIGTLDPAAGGPSVVVLRLAEAQARLGHNVSILALQRAQRIDVIDNFVASSATVDRLRLRRITLHRRMDRVLLGSLMREFDGLLPALDVLHLHGLWELMLLRIARRAKLANTPYIITPHGMLDPWSLSQKRLKKRIALAVAFRGMLNAAATLHALNDDEKRLLQPLRLQAPVVVIANGVDLNEIHPLPEPGRFRAAHPEVGDQPYLLFLSRLHYKKGLDILADAFAQFVERGGAMHLVVAGPDGGVRQDFERRIREHGLEKRVHLVGPLYGPQKIEALRDAAGFVLPSRQEGFSVAITEAMAVGLPVIITDSCHFPEVAEVGAGFITQPDADQIAGAITRLAGDPSAAEAMGRRARQLVESRFTWPHIAKKMVSAYQNVLERSKAR